MRSGESTRDGAPPFCEARCHFCAKQVSLVCSCATGLTQGSSINVKTVKAALRKVLEQRGGGVRTL